MEILRSPAALPSASTNWRGDGIDPVIFLTTAPAMSCGIPRSFEKLLSVPIGRTPSAFPAACTAVPFALCIDKTQRTLRVGVKGRVTQLVDARFGNEEFATREGVFRVFKKSKDHVSSLYKTPMPFALFFSGGQAVHYSSDFAARGYAGASHGCVNIRDYDAIASLYDIVQLGDSVVVYAS